MSKGNFECLTVSQGIGCLVQLILLRRYGYLSMIWFRVFYYLLWHVLWGEARLALLF